MPQVSKWGAWYYFKHYEIAAFLIERGMSAQHMNCHHTTLLHDMAYTGDVRKAGLLLEHGADIDAIDEEFRSTPLGLAARFGQRDMVDFLLDRGADPNRAGSPWATPLEWARKKGHPDIESRLRAGGASGPQPRRAAPKQEQDVAPEAARRAISAALDAKDPAAVTRLLREHHRLLVEHKPGWAGLDADTMLARTHGPRKLRVRPDIKAIEREVEEEGGGEAGRLAVAKAYGAGTWERLALAVRLDRRALARRPLRRPGDHHRTPEAPPRRRADSDQLQLGTADELRGEHPAQSDYQVAARARGERPRFSVGPCPVAGQHRHRAHAHRPGCRPA